LQAIELKYYLKRGSGGNTACNQQENTVTKHFIAG
jgi:hypothetical protein